MNFISTKGLSNQIHPGITENTESKDVKKSISDYIKKEDHFIRLNREKEKVIKLSDGSYSICSDFKDEDGEKTDFLDFWLRKEERNTKVKEIKIYKINCKNKELK
ncbi:MAG: hypothetical protein ABDH37_07845 [Candidatus Hydrothermales bacterium]